MIGLARRVTALESISGTDLGRWHRVIVAAGQTLEDAVDHYGRHLIRGGDRLIVRRVISGTATPL